MRKWVKDILLRKYEIINRGHTWDGRNYYQPFDDDKVIIFDCHKCGDPTSGSYCGPIMSNMCWDCNTAYQTYLRNYGQIKEHTWPKI